MNSWDLVYQEPRISNFKIRVVRKWLVRFPRSLTVSNAMPPVQAGGRSFVTNTENGPRVLGPQIRNVIFSSWERYAQLTYI